MEVMALVCTLQHNHRPMCVPQDHLPHPCSCPAQQELFVLALASHSLSLKVWCSRCFASFNLCIRLVLLF